MTTTFSSLEERLLHSQRYHSRKPMSRRSLQTISIMIISIWRRTINIRHTHHLTDEGRLKLDFNSTSPRCQRPRSLPLSDLLPSGIYQITFDHSHHSHSLPQRLSRQRPRRPRRLHLPPAQLRLRSQSLPLLLSQLVESKVQLNHLPRNWSDQYRWISLFLKLVFWEKSSKHDKPTPKLKLKQMNSLETDERTDPDLLGRGQGPGHDHEDGVGVDLSLPTLILDKYLTTPMGLVPMTTMNLSEKPGVVPPKPRVEVEHPKPKL